MQRIARERENLKIVDIVLLNKNLALIILWSPLKSGNDKVPETVNTIDPDAFNRLG